MHILFVSDNFPPEVNAPASRTYEHGTRWVSCGSEVTVVTCAPNFPQGRVYSGYRNSWRTVEHVDGIRVVRVKTYISRNDGFARRILDYVSFMLSSFLFGVFERRPDVVVGTSPQFFAAVGAWLLSLLKRRPFVFELRDLWPASIVTVGVMRETWVTRGLEKLELFLYRRAALIVSVTESFREDLIRRGIDGEKIVVVRNGVDLQRFSPCESSQATRQRLGLEDRYTVAYLGTHGMAHDLGNVLRAAKRLEDVADVCFLFVGDGAEKHNLVGEAEELGLRNVVFHDPVPKEDMPELWSVCDVALIHLKDDPVFATVIPSKIFEAFGMGIPVMLVQPDGEAADLVRDAAAGEWIRPGDPQALADAVLRWRSDRQKTERYAQAAADAARSNSRDTHAAHMLRALQRVVR